MPAVPVEVILEQYQLRSTFFSEKLGEHGFFDFERKINKIIEDQKDLFNWENRDEWGISGDAWDEILNKGINPLSIFCHPRIVSHHPKLIRYYRSVALLPQKGMQKISSVSGIKEIEEGKRNVPQNKVSNIVFTLNELVCSIIKLTPDIDSNKIMGMMYSTAGTSIDGSWRNQIGTEGERVVRSLLVKSLAENREIGAIVDKNDNSFVLVEWIEKYGDPAGSVTQIKSVVATNGASMYFSSEPDVTFMDAGGKVCGAVEIKAGIDPAGALERLGAMYKSFDNVLAITPNAETILVATCITEEVESRLRESNAVSKIFITTDVINNKSGRGTRFSNSARAIMGLIEKRL